VGTLLMGILCGHWRYAHLSGVRFDAVNPQLLRMGKVVSEDSARRFLATMSREQSENWLRTQMHACYGGLLIEPWVLDVDTTIKPIYGQCRSGIRHKHLGFRIRYSRFRRSFL